MPDLELRTGDVVRISLAIIGSDDAGVMSQVEPGLYDIQVDATQSRSNVISTIYHELIEHELCATGWAEKLGDDKEPLVQLFENRILPTLERVRVAIEKESIVGS